MSKAPQRCCSRFTNWSPQASKGSVPNTFWR